MYVFYTCIAENIDIGYKLIQAVDYTNQAFNETKQASNETIEHEKLLNQTVSKGTQSFYNTNLPNIW